MKRHLHRKMRIWLCSLVCGLWAMPLLANRSALPDSLITEDKVYEFTFSDTPLAERIMMELRKKGKQATHELDITEGDLYYNTGRFIIAASFYKNVVDEAVHHARGLAHLRDVGELRVEARLPRYGTLERVLSVDQPENPVAVEGDVERRGPLELTGLDVHRFERQLEAAVADLADVEHPLLEARRGGQQGVEQQVARHLVVPVGRHLDAVLEEPEVETRVPLLGGLPLEPLVGHVRDVVARHALAAEHIVERVARTRVDGDLRIEVVRGLRAVVARQAPREAQLAVAHPLALLQQILAVEVPRKAGRVL